MDNILLIMPEFFSTSDDISNALKSNGYNVVLYSDRPSKNNLIKAIIRVNRHLCYFKTKRYVKNIVKNNRDVFFSRIIIINGQSFTKKHVKYLFRNLKYEKSVFYMWDKIEFLPYSKKLLKLFDYTITFNIHDYKNKIFNYFLPLYISNEYRNEIVIDKSRYDMSFIGTGKPEKISFIISAQKYCLEHDLQGYFHIYLPSKLMYLFNKIFHHNQYKRLNKTFFKFNKLSHDEIKDIYSKSKCILDSGDENEGGLPLRVFEVLGTNQKLILKNKSIINYNFYDENQFCLIDEFSEFDEKFFIKKIDKKTTTGIYFVEKWALNLVFPDKIKETDFLKF